MVKKVHDLLLKEVRSPSPDYRVLVFQSSVSLPEIHPGQFAEIQAPRNVVFLRRPFSVYDIDYKNNTISFLIKKLGTGTRAMCEALPGEFMNVIFPLGKGFTLPPGPKVLLAAGGVGIAPMLILGRYLTEKGYTPEFVFGGRTHEEVVDLDLFSALGKVHVTTDDGSLGHPGLITAHPVFTVVNTYDRVYVCGPDPMMHAVARLCAAAGTDCEVSLENTMACGFGVCLSCVTETNHGNQTVCTAGPVFNIRELKGWGLPAVPGEAKP